MVGAFGSEETRSQFRLLLSYSALRWIEGDLKEAGESLEKARALAQQLPKAGAYEFERYRCSLLQQVLKDISAPIATPVTS